MRLWIEQKANSIMLQGDLPSTIIATIGKAGINRATSINEESGLKLDDYGEIVDED